MFGANRPSLDVVDQARSEENVHQCSMNPLYAKMSHAKQFYIDPAVKDKGDIETRLRNAGYEAAGFLHEKVDICVTDETAECSNAYSVASTPRLVSRRHRQLLTLQQQQATQEKNTWLLASQLRIEIVPSDEVRFWLANCVMITQNQVRY